MYINVAAAPASWARAPMALAAVDALHAYLLGAACVGEEERAEKVLRLLKVLDGETIGEGDEAKSEERFGAPGAVWTESERGKLFGASSPQRSGSTVEPGLYVHRPEHHRLLECFAMP